MAALDPVADLERRLDRGASTWRGMRNAIRTWWREHELADHPATVGKRIAIALIEKRRAVYKHAGTFVLELLADQLRCADLVAFAALFDAGHLCGDHPVEREAVDRFGTLVLAAMLDREPGRMEVARSLATWRHAVTIWQRRAACLAFVRLAPHADAELTSTILAVCGTVVWSHELHDQAAVATLLRELSRAEPSRVDEFFRRHARFMPRTCARVAVAKLPEARRKELLAHHKRATTI